MVAAVAALLWTSPAAGAHASLISSSPADGAQLDAAPTELSFDLNEAVSLVDGSAQLIDADGTRYPIDTARLDNGRQRIVLPLTKPLPDGAYLATARVVSADTHVVSLSIRFTVGAVTEHGQWAADGGQQAVSRAVVLPVKVLVYLGAIGSAGLFLAARWAWPDALGTRRFRVTYRVGLGLLIAGLVGRFTVLVTEQAGAFAAVSWPTVTAFAQTPFGLALVAAATLSLISLAVPRPTLVLGLAQAASTIIAITLGGHGASTTLWPLPFLATLVHVYAVTVWLGGVALIALRHKDSPPLGRWHRVAIIHITLLVVAGLVLAVLQVHPLAALVDTSYGITLLVKAGLAVAAIAAGFVAYRVVTARTRAVFVEVALAVLIVAATSVLSSLTPARDSYTTNVATRLDFGEANVVAVDIDTVRRGSQVLTVHGPAAEVGVELSSAQANVARLPVRLSEQRAEDGTVLWRSDGLIVPSAGRWKVTVRFDDGDGPKLASFFYDVL